MSDISGDWPAYVNDSGTLTDGTILNATLFDSIKAAINLQVYSSTNPTITPEDTIDEVVTARGSKANLNARLSVALNADGTLIAGSVTDYLNGTLDLGANWLIQSARELRMSGSGVAHGMTTLAATDVYAQFKINTAGSGGLVVRGMTDADLNAIYVIPVIGTTTPGVATMVVDTYKKNGTGVQALASTEIMLDIRNGNTTLRRMYGNGKEAHKASDVSHGMTDIDETDAYGSLAAVSAAGGLRVRGLSDTDAVALYLVGMNGSTTPTAATIRIDGYKKNGTTVQALAATENILSIDNNGSVQVFIRGDGSMNIQGSSATPYIEFDSNDYISFTKASNKFQIVIAGSPEMNFYNGGIEVVNGMNVGFVSGGAIDDTICVGDGTFQLSYNAGTPYILWDTNDSINYNRGTDSMQFYAGSAVTPRLSLDNGNIALGAAGSYGSGTGVVFIANAGANPSTNPTGGGILYSNAGALTWRGSAGTVTPIAPA